MQWQLSFSSDQRYSPFHFHIRGPFAKRHYDLAIELLNLPSEWGTRSYHLKIFVGNIYEKTKTYKVKTKDRGTTSTPRWTLDLDLSDNIKSGPRHNLGKGRKGLYGQVRGCFLPA
ncbi:hypothetical protein ARMGADRAFT_1083504 [Armillaria gallica]|uniref:Uncharacterized protein n=1 Tax=Armillaria gallica TaxID=47427 RepID=A0A2H3D6Y2_ARMGA|nr:hypothetical protein ARMGADRAFT_1083504 [Armillaria gallica]